MPSTTSLDYKIRQMALRIRELREIEGLSEEQMARKTGVSVEEYIACEKGDSDLNFAFLYRCASAFNVDVTDIIEGTSPNLSGYTLTRSGDGQKIEKAHGMTYFNLAHAFKNRIAEPLFVHAVYTPDEKIELTSHDGQECDIVIKGSLKVRVGDHIEVLHEGDSIYYDSSKPHGMAAVGNEDCLFYAIVLNPSGEPIPELVPEQPEPTQIPRRLGKESKNRIYKQWTRVEKNENGTPVSVEFLNTDRFNFAFDVVDELARTKPEKLAMLHLDKDMNERRFTFRDISRESARAAN
ncbi:MAG: cupin domain-containing protein, partial [Clostridia bacterium]|nr:cupin domain-containing protein [Clostridia bacterium]